MNILRRYTPTKETQPNWANTKKKFTKRELRKIYEKEMLNKRSKTAEEITEDMYNFVRRLGIEVI
jgi:hypothetical protein